LKNAHAARSVAQSLYDSGVHDGMAVEPIDVLTEQNVLLQMQHLKTHPSVAAAMTLGRLTLSGWVYNIASGEVEVAEDGQRTFTPIGTHRPTGA
jgi:carbonic anhydrase